MPAISMDWPWNEKPGFRQPGFLLAGECYGESPNAASHEAVAQLSKELAFRLAVNELRKQTTSVARQSMQGPKTHEQQLRILEKKPSVPDARQPHEILGSASDRSLPPLKNPK